MENALEHLFGARKSVIPAPEVRNMLDAWRDQQRESRERKPLVASLSDYDALLSGGRWREVAI